jgi:hypothetical protein
MQENPDGILATDFPAWVVGLEKMKQEHYQ